MVFKYVSDTTESIFNVGTTAEPSTVRLMLSNVIIPRLFEMCASQWSVHLHFHQVTTASDGELMFS
jgi:hypothetical protein